MLENIPISQNTQPNPRARRRLVVPAASPSLKPTTDLAVSRLRRVGFKKTDISRAISAAQKGGVTVSEMEIGKDGAIRLKFANGQPGTAISPGNDQFDDWEERL